MISLATLSMEVLMLSVRQLDSSLIYFSSHTYHVIFYTEHQNVDVAINESGTKGIKTQVIKGVGDSLA